MEPTKRRNNSQSKAPRTSSGWSGAQSSKVKAASLTIRRVKLSRIKPHEDNPRFHPTKGTPEYEALKASLLDDYFDPLVWNGRNGKLVSGHFRRAILLDEGFTEADAVVVDWDDAKHRRALVAANAHSGHWDDELLAQLLKSIPEPERSKTLLTAATLERLLEDGGGGGEEEFKDVSGITVNNKCPKCGFRF